MKDIAGTMFIIGIVLFFGLLITLMALDTKTDYEIRDSKTFDECLNISNPFFQEDSLVRKDCIEEYELRETTKRLRK